MPLEPLSEKLFSELYMMLQGGRSTLHQARCSSPCRATTPLPCCSPALEETPDTARAMQSQDDLCPSVQGKSRK